MNKLTIDGLGKRYELGSNPDEGGPFAWFRKIGRRVRRRPTEESAKPTRDFWALKDVSFTVEPGTVLGLIGANGAGKTTLLKILARVIRPTEGRVLGVSPRKHLPERSHARRPPLRHHPPLRRHPGVRGGR
jgi:lipopolysaccharide transport system ATP-binding protein